MIQFYKIINYGLYNSSRPILIKLKCICKDYSKKNWPKLKENKKFILGAGVFTRLVENPDAIDAALIEKKKYKFVSDEELTGFERLKKMFSYDEYGIPSSELALVCYFFL